MPRIAWATPAAWIAIGQGELIAGRTAFRDFWRSRAMCQTHVDAGPAFPLHRLQLSGRATGALLPAPRRARLARLRHQGGGRLLLEVLTTHGQRSGRRQLLGLALAAGGWAGAKSRPLPVADIVDSHVHVWKIDPRYPFIKQAKMAPPDRDATPEALARA